VEVSIIIILLLLSIIQSIFGIGLLVLGTPIFLILNYSFTNALSILLPTSILINLVHILKTKKIITNSLKKIIFLYCIPFISIGCIISYKYEQKINFKFLIGSITLFLIFYKIFFLKKNYSFFSKYKIIIFQIIGFIHGISNSGGALLSLAASIFNKNNKIKTRNTISFFYFFFAITQYIILLIINSNLFLLKNIIYISVVVLLGSYLGNKIFFKLATKKYIIALDFLIIFASMTLLFSAFY
jgi:uncharacterized membrane protein YfcA